MAGLFVGSTGISKVYLGSTEAKAVYLGSTKIWPNSVTISSSVTVDGDDGFVTNTGTLSATTTGAVFAVSASGYSGFIRFSSVSVPQGAMISSASMSISSWKATASGPQCTLSAVASDNPSTPASGSSVTGATSTVASVAWSNASVQNVTPDLSAVIQEIVNRPGWVSGNAIMILVRGISGSGSLQANAQAETLSVTYS